MFLKNSIKYKYNFTKMRYLKKFNESLTQDEIRDFCEMHLVYLLDDGYELAFREIGRITQINCLKPNGVTPIRWTPGQGGQVDWFNWDDIKNRFIPFLQILNISSNSLGVEIISFSFIISLSSFIKPLKSLTVFFIIQYLIL